MYALHRLLRSTEVTLLYGRLVPPVRARPLICRLALIPGPRLATLVTRHLILQLDILTRFGRQAHLFEFVHIRQLTGLFTIGGCYRYGFLVLLSLLGAQRLLVVGHVLLVLRLDRLCIRAVSPGMRGLLLLWDGLLALGGLLFFFLVALVIKAVQRPLFLDLLCDLTVRQHGYFFGAVLRLPELLVRRRLQLKLLALLPLGRGSHVPYRDMEVDVVVRTGVVHHVVRTVVDLVVIGDMVHLLDDI